MCNGNRIKVLSDPWIPDVTTGFVQTLGPLPDDIQLEAFLEPVSHVWDADLVCANFAEETANKILQIPINRHADGDYLSWPHHKFCCYTVRSACNLARSDKFLVDRSRSGRGINSSSDYDGGFLKKLWAMKAPEDEDYSLAFCP